MLALVLIQYIQYSTIQIYLHFPKGFFSTNTNYIKVIMNKKLKEIKIK